MKYSGLHVMILTDSLIKLKCPYLQVGHNKIEPGKPTQIRLEQGPLWIVRERIHVLICYNISILFFCMILYS